MIITDPVIQWGPEPIALGFIGAPLATAISFNSMAISSIAYGIFFVPRTERKLRQGDGRGNSSVVSRLPSDSWNRLSDKTKPRLGRKRDPTLTGIIGGPRGW